MYFLKANKHRDLITCYGQRWNFSTSGVLDSAGNAKVSFLIKNQTTNNLPHFLITVSNITKQSTNRLSQDYSACIPSHQAVNTITVHFYQ